MLSKFSHETNGYNRAEVNEFINDVIKESQTIVDKCKRQQGEIENLKEQLNHYKNLEDAIKESLANIEKKKDLAEKEAEVLLSEARNNANRIINEALIKADELDLKNTLLEKNMTIFKKKLRTILKQQEAVIEEIDNIEL